MSSIIGHALIVDILGRQSPVRDGVYTFPTESEAVSFAVAKIVAAGWCNLVGGQYVLPDGETSFASERDVLHAYRAALPRGETYRVVYHRSPEATPCSSHL